MSEFPTLQEVMAIHKILLKEFGGSEGLRDLAALESALMRPQLGYYDNLLEKAAALMESLANNHPFIDGNKRVAFFVTDTFLRMNKYYTECDNEKAYITFMGFFEKGIFEFAKLLPWLEQKTRLLS